MPRNGTATTAKEPNDFYDSLSSTEQEVYDLIGSQGFRPSQANGLWFAERGKEKAGPKESISELAEAVDAHVKASEEDEIAALDADNPEYTELTDDGEGNVYLPGTAPQVITPLANAILEYDRVKLERVELSNQETTAKKRMTAMLRKFDKYLTDKTDDDGKVTERFYAVGKARGYIKIEEKEVVGSDHNVPSGDDD